MGGLLNTSNAIQHSRHGFRRMADALLFQDLMKKQVAHAVSGNSINELNIAGLSAESREFYRGELTKQRRDSIKKTLHINKHSKFSASLNLANKGIGQSEKERVLAAWRITKLMALISNRCDKYTTLTDSMKEDPVNKFPWLIPDDPQLFKFPQALDEVSRQQVLAAYLPVLHASLSVPEEKKVSFPSENGNKVYNGIPYTPPKPPRDVINPYTGELNEEYDPSLKDCDPILHFFVELIKTCAEILDLQSGSSNFPEYGEVAMMFFTSPAVIRASWPGYIQIMQFEQDIMEYTQDVVVNLSNSRAKAELRMQYGLKEFEINSLLLATREYIKNELDQESDDMQRASLYRKYERIGQDARGISPEKEAAAMKALSDLKGLNKSGEGRGGVELNKLFKDADTMIEEGEIDYEEDYLSDE